MWRGVAHRLKIRWLITGALLFSHARVKIPKTGCFCAILRDMKRFITSLFLFFLALTLSAEIITSEKFNYSIDFPEGYEIIDMEEDESTVILKNKYLAAHALIKVWPFSKFKDSKEALTDTFSRLQAKADYSQSEWRHQACTIANFESQIVLPDQRAKGWACCIPLQQKKSYLTFLSYAPTAFYEDLAQVLISPLDSILIDKGCYKEPGLITSAFYARKNPKKIDIEIAGKKIQSQIDAVDKEANQAVIDREFSIFSFYALNNCPEMYDAWIRFYRLIAKDTMERVRRVSFDIYSSLKDECEAKDKDNPDAALAQELLFWSQGLCYERKSTGYNKADIESLPGILEGANSDCDGRSLLLMCLLKNCSIESCMFISAQFGHALLGVYLPDKQGQSLPVEEGKNYIVGETTAKGLTLGIMPADMTDRNGWLCVELP